MAIDKKSFVLYSDLIHTVKKLPNEKAGELFKHILSYVNDENPVTDDILIEISFEPIKQQLKRDLLKYEEKRKQWSDAGKKSAEVRGSKKIQRTLTNVESRSTDSTVNDNVNVNVNVNDNVNDNKKVLFPFESEIFKTQWQLWKVYKSKEFGFKYKSVVSENGALEKLESLSGGDEKTAIKIIKQSINDGWKGFFELKTTETGKNANIKVSVSNRPKIITGAEAFKNQFIDM